MLCCQLRRSHGQALVEPADVVDEIAGYAKTIRHLQDAQSGDGPRDGMKVRMR